MARGDVRPTVSHYGRGSYGRSSSSSRYHDDEGRGESKQVWEWFEENFGATPTLDWLLSLDDQRYYWLIKASTYRHGILDIAITRTADIDSRARRMVRQKLDVASWCEFHAAMVAAFNRVVAKRDADEHEAAERYRGERAAYVAQREATAVRIAHENWVEVAPGVDMTVGMLSSDLNQAFVSTDRIGQNGDWIEETVEAYQGEAGFGYEDKKAVGVKIQITLSLDLSNSMLYNGVAIPAAAAFRDIGLSLKEMKKEYEDDLFTAFFTFSADGYRDNEKGKRVYLLQTPAEPKPESLGEFDPYAPSQLIRHPEFGYGIDNIFSGTDTYINPLLANIERWEKENSDPGAVKLDLVLTDAVLEHKSDIREADVIQDRRDGTLTTVMLNFMPESEWLMSTLPKRCYQMHVDADNIQGVLRNTITEFVAAHM